MQEKYADVWRATRFTARLEQPVFDGLAKQEPALAPFRPYFFTSPQLPAAPEWNTPEQRKLYHEFRNPELTKEQRLDKAAEFFSLIARERTADGQHPAQRWQEAQQLPSGLMQGHLDTHKTFLQEQGETIAKNKRGPAYSRGYSWKDATKTVTRSLKRFHPEMATIAEDATHYGWMHVIPADFVQRGFSQKAAHAYLDPGNHPYVFMEFDGKLPSVSVLAHELAHAAIQYLESEKRPQSLASMALHETFAHFTETLAMEDLLARERNPSYKAGILKSQIVQIGQLAEGVDMFEYRLYEEALKHDAPLTHEQIRHIAAETRYGTADVPAEKVDAALNAMADTHHFSSQPPHYLHNYTIAEASANTLMRHYKQLSENGKREFAETAIDIMRNTAEYDYGSAMEKLGVQTIRDGKLDMTAATETLHEKVAALGQLQRRSGGMHEQLGHFTEQVMRELGQHLHQR